MRIERRGRAVSALLAILVVARPAVAAPGAPAEPARSASADARVAASSATLAGCSATADCGSGCIAELATGYCVLAVKWQGGISLGGVQIGPSVSAECSICECWYIYTSSNGYEVFKRTTSLQCSAELGGVDLQAV